MRKRKSPLKRPYKDPKGEPDLRLLLGFAIMSVMNFLDYYSEDKDGFADESALRVLKRYKNYKDEVQQAFRNAFKYLLEDSKWKDRRKKESVIFAKKRLNELAKKVWK